MQNVRNALILASGHGKRMRLITNGMVPKQLLCLARDKPIIQFSLEALPASVERIFIVIGPHGEKIQSFCGNHFQGKPICYLEQPECDGTAAAVIKAKGCIDEPFLAISGDDLYRKKDLTALSQFSWGALGFRTVKAMRIYKLLVKKKVSLEDIREVQDFETDIIACTGAFMLQPEIFEAKMAQISTGEFDLPRTLMGMIEERKLEACVHLARFWVPIDTPMDFAVALTMVQNGQIS